MLAPTIAALVPAVKSPAKSSAGQDGRAPEGDFSRVLAGRVAEGAPSGQQVEAKSDRPLVRHASAGSNDKPKDIPLDPSGLTDTEKSDAANDDKLEGNSEEYSALPAIFLDIAAQVPRQNTETKPSGVQAPELASVRADGHRTALAATAAFGPAASGIDGDTEIAQNPALTPAAARTEGAHILGGHTAARGSLARSSISEINLRAAANNNASGNNATAALADNIDENVSARPLEAADFSRTERPAGLGFASVDAPHAALISNPNPAGFTPAPGALPNTVINTPLHQAGWDADFSRQMVTLARHADTGTHTAELRLDPPELGPLRISLSLNEGMASALFVSAHASVRQAIEAALPQLSQQLAQAGISLGETHVGEQGQAGFAFNDDTRGNTKQNTGPITGNGSSTEEPAQPARGLTSTSNLVDTFA